MKPKLSSPQILCWLFVPVLVLLGIIAGDHELTLYQHDTYYVVPYRYLSSIILILTIAYGFMYRALSRKQWASNKKLISIHLFFSFAGMLILLLIAVKTAAFTSGDTIGLSWEWRYFIIVAQIAALAMFMIGLMMMLITLGISWINK